MPRLYGKIRILKLKKMKITMKLKLSIIFLFSAISLSLLAQTEERDTTFARQITIEREYQPVIQAAGKINSMPFFIEPRIVRRTPVFNTDFSQPLAVESTIHHLAAAELIKSRTMHPEGFVRAGIGTGFNSLADVALPLVRQPNTRLDFILNHEGLHNNKAHSRTQAALMFDHKMRTLSFYAGLSGGHEFFRYFGDTFDASNQINSIFGINLIGIYPQFLPTNDLRPQLLLTAPLADTNTLWRVNANAGIRTSPTTDELRYGIHLNYNLLTVRNGLVPTDERPELSEQVIELRANIDGEIAIGNRLGVDLTSTNIFYANANNALDTVFQNQFVLGVNPYYSIERDAFNLRLGAEIVFAQNDRNVVMPDVRFEWRAVPRLLAVYAGLTGDYQINTMNRMFKQNIFLSPDVMVANTFSPVKLFFGAKISPMSGLLFDAFVSYRAIDNQYFFVNREYIMFPPFGVISPVYSNRFDALYSQANHLRLGGSVSYRHHNRFNAQLNFAYNHWSIEDFTHAWHKPIIEMDINANVQITQRLNVFATCFFEGIRYAGIGREFVQLNGEWQLQPHPVRLAPIIDITLGASYAVRDWWSVFVRANNLINSRHQVWYGYEVQGFMLTAGAAFNF